MDKMRSPLPAAEKAAPVSPTQAAKLRLALAVLLFAAWLGWLLYLVLTTATTRQIVLSRPQFLVSSLDVIAQIDQIEGPAPEVTIREVLWPENQVQKLQRKKIKVEKLGEARADWIGPGEYLLPLVQMADDGYQVARTPPSPGFHQGGPRIYPLTEETRGQYQTIHKSEALVPEQRK
jgi:hypothetical protein